MSLSVGEESGANTMAQCDMDAMRSDVTGDGYWDSKDVAAVVNLFGQAAERGTRADIHPITADGFVDISDLVMIRPGFSRHSHRRSSVWKRQPRLQRPGRRA